MRFSGLIGRPWRVSLRLSSRAGHSLEVTLMLVLAVQVARLFWAGVAPLGAFGDWRPFEPFVPGVQARASLFSSFDPFYRLASTAGTGDVQQVTSLPFRLYGIRINESSGLGSAIIADQSGVQSSYAMGEEIMPGISLKAVSFDHVTISRNGADETLYIDQSGSAPDGAPAGAPAEPLGMPSPSAPPPPANPPPVASGEPVSPQALLGGVGFAPRTENGNVTGVVLSPQGNGEVFARAGFQAGDIVAQMNGLPIRSQQDIASLRSAIKPGARLTLMVERGAATVPIAIIIPDNK